MCMENSRDNRERVAYLASSALAGALTAVQRAEFDDWLAADPANRAFFEKLSGKEYLAGNLGLYDRFDPRQAAADAALFIENNNI